MPEPGRATRWFWIVVAVAIVIVLVTVWRSQPAAYRQPEGAPFAAGTPDVPPAAASPVR